MHVGLICPFSGSPTRGNIVTVRRVAAGLAGAGCRVTTIPLDTLTQREQQRLLAGARPDLLHAFHAFHAGPTTARHARMLNIPYLLTITGSDLFDTDMRDAPRTLAALRQAASVICFDGPVADQLVARFPELAATTCVIPQGVTPLPVPASPAPPPPANGGKDFPFVILLPAAIRPVKGILEALEALTPLADALPQLRLVLAGGDLDPAYAEEVRHRAAERPWVRMAGDISHDSMGALYTAAAVVLNNSSFEGGTPNALLEAMALGTPVAARDIAGNRSLVRHGETGWLFATDEALRAIILDACTRTEHRRAVGLAAQTHVARNFSPAQETEKLISLYRKILRCQ